MKDSRNYLFTSESVSEGHPDKVCDQISDTVLDSALEINPRARVACEVMAKTTGDGDDRRTQIVIAGEIGGCDKRELGQIDYEALTHGVIRDIGYTDPALGVDLNALDVHCWVGEQSADIAQGVGGSAEDAGMKAGDQGIMFGYACRETDVLDENVLMPAPIELAHRLMRRHADKRKRGGLAWLGPDAKSQVTIEYRGGEPYRVDTVVLSTQHTREITLDEVRKHVGEQIVMPVLPPEWMCSDAPPRLLINPAGSFHIGGPEGDCGLTGRKIIVDSYGGMARHGGGAYSGKDASKVDRSAAYAARYVAKNIVAAGLARRCEVQLSYAIGQAEPTSIHVDTFGGAMVENEKVVRAVNDNFDLTPEGIIDALQLRRPIYRATATYGHMGRSGFPWERCDKVDELRRAVAGDRKRMAV